MVFEDRNKWIPGSVRMVKLEVFCVPILKLQKTVGSLDEVCLNTHTWRPMVVVDSVRDKNVEKIET